MKIRESEEKGTIARNGNAGATGAHGAQPTCPACGSTDLRHEADDRHQCRKCLWRCRIGTNGKARDWLSIGKAGTLQARRRRPRAAG